MDKYLKPFEHKIVTADQAVTAAVSSGCTIVFSHAAATPQISIDALLRQSHQWNDVKIYHMLSLGPGAYMAPEYAPHLRHITNFVGGNAREAIAQQRADYMPAFFFEVPKNFRTGLWPVDVAIVQVSKPDSQGRCSFGVSCDYSKPAAHAARVVIAEMNEQMPCLGGDNSIHLSEIDYIVPCSYPIYELPQGNIGAVEQAIGGYCAELIEDGSTLQLGIGAIPDAVLKALHNKQDLGIHTEMFSDGVIDLVEKGVINGSKKTLHPGKMVATFLMGSRKFYDFVNNNPQVELYPVDYVNHPCIIMQNHKMISINSCIEVDFMGQVGSECIGSKQFSGTGGQVDYVRGVSMATGGKSIMAMPSTAAGGKLSRIVPNLAHGAAVTTTRNDVDYVVTEYGIAHLKGQSIKERARRLIQIAHPDFRSTLQEELLKKM